MAGSRHLGRRRFAVIAGAMLAVIALAGGSLAAEEDEGRKLPIDLVHNNLKDAPVAGAVFGSGPALKNGSGDLHHPDHERRERQRELRGHGTPQRDLDLGKSGRIRAT